MGASRLTTVSIDHLQQPMPRGFPLFKRCEWLVVNRDMIKRISPVSTHPNSTFTHIDQCLEFFHWITTIRKFYIKLANRWCGLSDPTLFEHICTSTLSPLTWRSRPLIEVVEVETRVEWETDNRDELPSLFTKAWLVIVALQSNNNQSGFGRQRRKFVLLSASHSTRVSTPTTSISDPGLHVDDYHPLSSSMNLEWIDHLPNFCIQQV